MQPAKMHENKRKTKNETGVSHEVIMGGGQKSTRDHRKKNFDALSKYRKEHYYKNKERYIQSAKDFYHNKKNPLSKKPTCEILKHHAEELKDDPERLTTDFIIKLIKKEKQ